MKNKVRGAHRKEITSFTRDNQHRLLAQNIQCKVDNISNKNNMKNNNEVVTSRKENRNVIDMKMDEWTTMDRYSPDQTGVELDEPDYCTELETFERRNKRVSLKTY